MRFHSRCLSAFVCVCDPRCQRHQRLAATTLGEPVVRRPTGVDLDRAAKRVPSATKISPAAIGAIAATGETSP